MRFVFLLLLTCGAAAPAIAQTCSGCSCKGGPGFRLPNGHCSSWKQTERFCDGTCYPAGTVDERPPPAPRPPIHKPVLAPS